MISLLSNLTIALLIMLLSALWLIQCPKDLEIRCLNKGPFWKKPKNVLSDVWQQILTTIWNQNSLSSVVDAATADQQLIVSIPNGMSSCRT